MRIYVAASSHDIPRVRRVMAAYDAIAEAVEEKPGTTPGEAKKDDVVPIKRGKK